MEYTEFIPVLDLQLFAEGAGTGTGDSGADAVSNQQSEPEALPSRHGRKPNPLANVRYGIQPEDAVQADDSGEGSRPASDEGAEPTREEWEALKKGKFAKLYGEDVSSTVKDRLKNSKQAEDNMGKLKPVLEQLAKRTGKDINDLDGIVASYMDDDSLYEDEAMERGVSVSTLKSIKQLERANAEYKAQQEATAQQQMFDRHISMLADQAEQLKAIYPDFDLRTELQNPRFARMTSPDGGVSVADAYYAVHHDELERGLVRTVAEQTSQRVANAVASGQNRPKEGMTRRNAPGLDVRDDPRKWTKMDREEVRRRVARGEKIVL